MKKRMMSLMLAGAMVLGTMTGAAVFAEETGDVEGIQASPEFYAEADLSVLEGKKIGVTIQSLQNAYWAGVMSALQLPIYY